MRLTSDFSFALRTAYQKPGYTFVLLAALTLGIGLTTAIFSVFYAVLLKPLPFRDSGALVLLREKLPDIPVPINLTPAEAVEFSSNPAFNGASIFRSSSRNLQGEHPERIEALRASASLMPLLGVTPARGRAFTEQEDAQGARVALITEGLEQRWFGAQAGLGKSVFLDGVSYEVIGILPRSLVFPLTGMQQSSTTADVWIPLSLTPEERSLQNPDYSYSLIARLRPEFTVNQAQSAAAAAIARILSGRPTEGQAQGSGFQIQAVLLPLQEEVVAGSRRLLFLLLGSVAVLLLISCMNVSNMLLNRALARRRELALRVSLGADAKAIVQQLLVEALILFVTAGLLGLLCASWSEHALIRLLPPDLPRLQDVRTNGLVLVFALVVSTLTGLLFGLVPAMSALRQDLAHTLNDGFRSLSVGPAAGRVRRLLVISQVALAFVLLTAAGLLLRSFTAVLDRQASLRTERILTFGVALPKEQYASVADMQTFYRELARRLQPIPGVLQVGYGTDLPLENRSGRLITPERATVQSSPIVHNTDVEGAYLQTLSLPLREGRLLNEHDTNQAEPVAVVNQAFGRAFWGSRSPLDHRFKMGPPSASGPWIRIAGVVADSAARAPDQPAEPRIYLPMDQDPYRAMAIREAWFVLRTSGDALPLAQTAQSVLRSLDPDMPVVRLRSMAQVVAGAVAPRSANTWLLGVFSLSALLLSSLGIYGVIAQSVLQRTREIGTRIALGARPPDISRLILWEGGKLVVAGLAVGVPASFTVSVLIRTLLYGVSPDDSMTRFVVAGAVVAAAMIALLVPMWRAIHIDPQVALREG